MVVKEQSTLFSFVASLASFDGARRPAPSVELHAAAIDDKRRLSAFSSAFSPERVLPRVSVS